MYNDYKIDKITVKSFRGISYESSINLGDITILSGENGTGKSSFVNAFEYIFSKELDFLKRDTIEKDDSIIHDGNTKEDIGIKICFSNGKILEYNKKPKDPELKEITSNDYVKNASFILNRRNLLRFVEGNRSDRYIAVMDLCGFNKLKRYQSNFSSTYKDFNKDFEKKLIEYDEKLGKLSHIIVDNYDAKYEESILELNKIIKRNDLDLIDDDTNISEYLANLHIDSEDYITLAKREFELIFDDINKDDLDLELKNLLSEYENVVYDNFKSTNDLIAILDKSYDYIELNKPEKCPVCDSNIDVNILETIDNNRAILKEKDKEFSDWKHKFNSYLSKLNKFIVDLEDLDANIFKLKSNDSSNELLNINFNMERLILRNLYSDLNDLVNTGEKINVKESLFKEMDEKISLLKENLEKYFEENRNNSDLFIINDALVELSKIKDLEAEISNLELKRLVAKKALDTYTKSKEDFINGIINEIKEDIKFFYDYIHKDDAITSPDIKLTGANHLEVFLNSFGKSVDPRSFASEGHLDSLGLCIFLAFNKKFNPIPFIILDDVIATVDMGHKEKIARLLIEELDDYQIFITTHSKLWAEQLRRLTNISNRNPESYEIISWNKWEGPILAKPIDSEKKIQQYLNPEHYDLNAAGNTARRYLEYLLKQICRANKLEIPYEDKPQCEYFYNKASSHIKKAAKGTSFEKYYNDIWKELEKTKFMANVLSHDNIDFDEISYNEVKDFCDAVINLRKEVICNEHNDFYLVFDKSLKSMTCSKSSCKFLIDMNTFKFDDDEKEETNDE